jgi:acyl-CoA reductase-like NAD-dependent aldehyde dehydrogenase
VVAAICPWNFPLILSSIKVFSALATGNCVIVKPSPFTPYSVLKWVELARGIVPPGVFQALNGGADLGGLMTSHPGIDMITFTGTIGTGKKVMASCAKTLKRVTLELAGNDAAVVCEDVDLKETAAKVAAGGFFNAGQMCVATKRVYVHERIYDEFLDALVAEVERGYTIQDDAKTPCPFGPLDNKMQYEVVKGMLEDCRRNGYRIATGGKVREKGFWLEPTVVVKPDEGSLLVREEQFGEFPIS